MNPRDVTVMAAVATSVVLAHYAYYLWPAGADRRWAKYVGDGAALAVLCLIVGLRARQLVGVGAPLLLFAAAWGVWDGLQQVLCGSLRWGKAVSGADLCIEQFGPWPYIALASGLLVWAVTRNK